MKTNAQINRWLALAATTGVVGFILQGCVTTEMASSEPLGPWQQDIRGLADHIQANEEFWKTPATEEPVDWTSKIWEISRPTEDSKAEDICIWLEVPYAKDKTRAGLWPVPVQVLIPADSDMAKTVDALTLRKGQRVHIKGTFKGFIHAGIDYSTPGDARGFGQANDAATALSMMFKMVEENPLQKQAEAYAKSKSLPLGTTPLRRIILPNMEVKAQEIDKAD